MSAPRAFMRRDHHTCIDCGYALVRDRTELAECTRNHILIRWAVREYGCGDFAARDDPVAIQTKMSQYFEPGPTELYTNFSEDEK